MGTKITPNEHEVAAATSAVNAQFERFFTQETREQMYTFGIQAFFDQMIVLNATDQAYIRFYANCLHSKTVSD